MTLAATTGGDVGGITGWILSVVETFGAAGLAVLNIVDTFFPPIPSEVFLPAGGYLASQGRLTFVGAWIGATVGSIVGAWLLFWCGHALGAERVQGALTRLPLVDGDDLDRADAWFERHGDVSVLFGRLVPGIRSLVSLPAGASSMHLGRFTVLTLVGSGVWNAALIAGGWFLGSQWGNVESWSTWIDVALGAAVVVVLGRFVWKRRGRISVGAAS